MTVQDQSHPPTVSAPPTARRGASRSALLIALGVSLILISFVLYISSRGGPGPKSAVDEFAPEDIPDILDQPADEAPDIRETGQGLRASTNARIKLKDRDDPSRIAWDLSYERLNSIRDTDQVEVIKPKAWYLLADNTLVYIRSDTATFLMPDVTGEPESGRFIGNVEMLQLERLSDGSLPEPTEANSAVRITTDWLDFDSIASELSTTELVKVTSSTIDAKCEGLRAVFNEVDERIELLEVPGELIAVVRPEAARANNEPGDDPGPPGSPSAQQERPAAAQNDENAATTEPGSAGGVEQFYAVTFEGSVHVEQPARWIEADRARVWIRLVDNAIPEAGFARTMPRHHDPIGIEAALLSMAVAASQPEVPDARELRLSEPVLFRCVGPTIVRPMSDRPAALGSGDDVALRFESDQGGVVDFHDDILKATGKATAIEYGFTSKILALTGYDGQPTELHVEDSGSIIGESLVIGLSTGIGQAAGAGILTEAETGRSVSWSDQADVVFRVEEGWITGSIEQAIASGQVELHDADVRVSAESINTRFAEGSGALIERAVLAGGVEATTSDGQLSANRLDVRFEITDGRSVPAMVIATGSVMGQQDESRIAAGVLEADLVEDEQGRISVSQARASENVRFERSDGAFAEGDRLLAELGTQWVKVDGLPARVGANGATVAAAQIELDGQSSGITVPGAGEFALLDEEGVLTLATAEWTGSMHYADDSGEFEAVGEVRAISTPNALSRDTILGEHIVALVRPVDNSQPEDDRLNRQLLSASVEGSEDVPASVESLRFAEVGDADPAQVTLLIGSRIEVDNVSGQLRVPTPGRLLVSDVRLDPDASDQNSLRGSALFDWDGQLLLDRPAGRVSMSRRVRMVHRPKGEGAVVELECESLTAGFDEQRASESLTETADGGRLREVEASGAVWARSDAQQLLADALKYDASTQKARATAAGGGWVTLFDPSQASPVTAAELIWSLKTGRIEVLRPNPVSLPR